MSSDAIKEALVEAYPGSSEKDWKRRTKKNEDGNVVREFEHATHGRVITYESSTGITLVGKGVTPPTTTMFPAAPVAAPAPAPVPTPAPAPVMKAAAMVHSASVPNSNRELISITMPELQHNFSEGDRVSIPAGVEVFGVDYSGPNSPSILARGITAKIADIIDIPVNWVWLADEEYRKPIYEAVHMIGGRGPNPNENDLRYVLRWIEDDHDFGMSSINSKYSMNPALLQALANAKANVLAKYASGFTMIVWGGGNDRKATLVSNVSLAKAQEVKAPKPKTITKRNQMVVGSIWVFDRDCEISLWMTNPARTAIERRHGGSGYARDPEWDKTPAQIYVKALTIPAGTRIKIIGKSESAYYSYGSTETNGLMFPVEFPDGHRIEYHTDLGTGYKNPLYSTYTRSRGPGSMGNMLLPYKAIADFVTAEAIPEELAYVLRDSATGQFFGGWETKHGYQTNNPKMVERFSSAKKYATASAAKASIRDFTGYNDGLEYNSDSPREEWVANGSKKIDLPETWEMVAVDKTTVIEKEVIEIQEWFKDLMRLRVLTVTHGSAARGAFKKAEGKEGINGLLVVKNMESGTDYQGKPYREPIPWEDDDRAASKLKAIAKAGKVLEGKSYKEKSGGAVAYACSIEDAFLFKLTLGDPDLDVIILDMTTLEEIVEQGAV